MKIDLRPRCARCRKLPRGKLREAEFKRYAPFCSFHCQEWNRLEEAQRHLSNIIRAKATGELP